MNYFDKFKNKFFFQTQNQLLKKKLIKELLPNKKINYNFFYDKLQNYENEFLHKYLYYVLPLCLENFQIKNNNFPRILDLGCGFAPMCLAAKIYRDNWENITKKKNSDKPICSYVGIDIRKDAIEYNKTKYYKYPENYFLFHDANENIDYIGDFKKFSNKASLEKATNYSSNGQETNYKIPFDYLADIQWSSSVITHMTPEAFSNFLKFISQTISTDGVSINTCHIIDPESLYLMNAGLSDRYLKYDFGYFLTYSKKNPLLNTAYKIHHIYELYEKNGLKITNIIKGSWRNVKKKQEGIDQDIIIAKKI